MTANDSLIRIIFELMPVFLASLSLVYCSLAVGSQTNWKDKFLFVLACINCLLMMAAQISWTWTVYVGNTIGTLVADYTWTIFNSFVMIGYLVMASKKG